MSRALRSVASIVIAAGVVASAQQPSRSQDRVSLAELAAAVNQLGHLDFSARMNAARTVRRAAPADAVPALIAAITGHKDGYVRFRSLILLTGFNDPRTDEMMLRMTGDPNDRIRTVAYAYLEHSPRAGLVPRLLKALPAETGEFVRPALVRTLAAHGDDPRVQQTLLVEVGRGQDFFRSAVIEALGDYRAQYAVTDLIATTTRDGPLRQDATVALGKIGDQRAVGPLSELQRDAPRELQPVIAASLCLLRVNCPAQIEYLSKTIAFGIQTPGYPAFFRNATIALATLGTSGNRSALKVLWDAGAASDDPVRGPLALAAATVALRNTPLLLQELEARPDRERLMSLLQEGFDLLEEDFAEERFYVTVRRGYWQAGDGSSTRRVAEALIQKLEF
jgi:HEAT repeat protein